jgi:hypothetical protein
MLSYCLDYVEMLFSFSLFYNIQQENLLPPVKMKLLLFPVCVWGEGDYM